MSVNIRTHLDNLLSSNEISREIADCVYEEYLRLKQDYLAGKLDKSALEMAAKIRIELEKDRVGESPDLPNVEDMVLFVIARSICEGSSLYNH